MPHPHRHGRYRARPRMSRRTATALLLTRGEGSELSVYLAERAPELRFFGGYWALPGGTVGPEDTAPGAAADGDAALQACAHRELFEELGLLRHRLPATRTSGDVLGALREQLLAHEAKDARPPRPAKDSPAANATVATRIQPVHRRRNRGRVVRGADAGAADSVRAGTASVMTIDRMLPARSTFSPGS